MSTARERRGPPADGWESVREGEPFDAILVVSFGGPEGMDDVLPFLENVVRGRGVPRERIAEVARHYERFGGVSPLNAQNRALIEALRPALARDGIDLPIVLGNRNWHPFLEDALRELAARGSRRVLAFCTSGFSCYSGCRQYREDIWRAQQAVGPTAPEVEKTRLFGSHPGFVAAQAERVRDALADVPEKRRAGAVALLSAHSIPAAMARASRYETELAESARLVAHAAGVGRHEVVYQSRSGPPDVPWLEPDVSERIRGLAAEGVQDVVVVPLGFASDHLEVLWDLDEEACSAAAEVGIGFVRAASVGAHPRFVAAASDLIRERIEGEDQSVGRCPAGCCLPGTGARSPWE
ncbi:MAG: ferrochelatase [Thermoleophilia bacterium]|nr:ferrochelatase [Thermoleophilia bacterium]